MTIVHAMRFAASGLVSTVKILLFTESQKSCCFPSNEQRRVCYCDLGAIDRFPHVSHPFPCVTDEEELVVGAFVFSNPTQNPADIVCCNSNSSHLLFPVSNLLPRNCGVVYILVSPPPFVQLKQVSQSVCPSSALTVAASSARPSSLLIRCAYNT
jgi:hypothetical protein